jgi:cell wall-associated NlpC family hydrolase
VKTALGIIALAILLLITSCAPSTRYSGTVTKPESEQEQATTTNPPPETPSRINADKMNKVIAQYMSVPYRSGGTGRFGLDCSGFVYVVYRDYDETRLPLTVRSQYRLDNRVEYDDLTYGDLIFFTTDKRKVSHVGIYLGEGKFVHASKSRGVVIDNLTDDYWIERYSGARRVVN